MTPTEAAAFRRRLLWLAGLLGLALVAVLVNAALNGGGNDGGPANPIRAAAIRTEREAGGHAAVEMLFTVAGETPLAATGHAVFDFASGRSLATLVGPAGGFGKEDIEAYADRDAGYVSSPGYRHLLPPGIAWMRGESWLGGNTKTSLPGRWNPADQVRMMRAAGEVEDLGGQEVLGVMTERYGGRVDLGNYAAILSGEGDGRSAAEFRRLAMAVPGSVRVEAWVDANERLRRVRTVTTLPPIQNGKTETVDIRADLMAYGAVTVPTPPPAADTLDLSPLLRWQDHLLAPRSIPPATGAPLGASAFRRRGNALCAKFDGLAKHVTSRGKSAGEALKRMSEEGPLGDSGQEHLLNAYKDYITHYFAPVAGTIHNFLDRLASLSPPTADQADWERLLHISAQQEGIFLAEVRAGQIGDIALAKQINDAQKPLSHRSDAIDRRLGLKQCIGKGGESGENEPSHSESPALN